MAIDAALEDWPDVAEVHPWPSLLVGNGASQSIWAPFGYHSLYETACEDVDDPLTGEDQALFEGFNTHNFEQVLTALWISLKVAKAVGLGDDEVDQIQERYDSIQLALIQAVREVHVPWELVPVETLAALNAVLESHERTYTTNYDLLLYWALMHAPATFKDYFWNDSCFDATDVQQFPDRRPLFFLHGALHLVRYPDGSSCKQTAHLGANLLDLFGQDGGEGLQPLFVSEGTAQEKEASIKRSNYLTFAHEQFALDPNALVIFGQSLGDEDAHLKRALLRTQHRRFAISMRPHGNAEAIIARKHQLHAALPNREITFFDASTHPLGNPALTIPN